MTGTEDPGWGTPAQARHLLDWHARCGHADSWGLGHGPDDHDPAELDTLDAADQRAALDAGWDPDDDPIVPTRAERAQGLFDRARDAQDRLGWADPADHREVTYATVDLARVVTDLARELRSLAREAL